MGYFLNITREKEKIGDLGVQLGQLRTARRSLVRRQLHLQLVQFVHGRLGHAEELDRLR